MCMLDQINKPAVAGAATLVPFRYVCERCAVSFTVYIEEFGFCRTGTKKKDNITIPESETYTQTTTTFNCAN